MRFPVLLAVLFGFGLSVSASSLLIVQGDQLPYYQTFDSWDLCFFDGTCYEKECKGLRGGFYNPTFRDIAPNPPEIRNWWTLSQQTPSNWDPATGQLVPCAQVQTGPCQDHTQGTSSGKYMYAESSACFAVLFDLISPTIVFTNASATISFWYFMFGSDISIAGNLGSLTLEVSTNNGTSWTQIFTISGQQQTGGGQPWIQVGPINLDTTFGVSANATNPITAEFHWRVKTGGQTIGTYWKSDIAIDDVLITQSGAPTSPKPWIDPNCTATGTCNPLATTSGGVEGTGGSGDGLSDGDIAGIVVGIVGGALLLCCLLLLLLLALLLLVSPRKPPQGGGGDL